MVKKKEIEMLHYNVIINDRTNYICSVRNQKDDYVGCLNLKVSYWVIPDKLQIRLNKFGWRRKLSSYEKELKRYLYFDCGIKDDKTIIIVESKETHPTSKYNIDLDVTIFNRKKDNHLEYIPSLHKISDYFFQIVNK